MPEEGTTATTETTTAATTTTTASEETGSTTTETLLQSGEATTETAKPEGDGAKPPAETSEEKTGAPEAYEFAEPEGFTLDQALLEKFTPLFKEANVSQEVAQKIVNEYASLQKAQVEAWQKTSMVDWPAEVKADKDFGGEKMPATLRSAQHAFNAVFTPEERKQVEAYGFLNFPPLVKALARIQTKFMAEDSIHLGSATTPEPTLAKAMFPDMK